MGRSVFTGVVDAHTSFAEVFVRSHSTMPPAVLMFHGYTGDSGDRTDKLGYAAAGFTVAALDCRGQGGLSEDGGAVKGTTMGGQIIRGWERVRWSSIFGFFVVRGCVE